MVNRLFIIMTAAAAAVGLTVFEGQPPQAQGADQQVATEALIVLLPGEIMPAKAVQFIEQPGHYGLGTEPRGSRYAIVQGHLVRVDTKTMELQSILRPNIAAHQSYR